MLLLPTVPDSLLCNHYDFSPWTQQRMSSSAIHNSWVRKVSVVLITCGWAMTLSSLRNCDSKKLGKIHVVVALAHSAWFTALKPLWFLPVDPTQAAKQCYAWFMGQKGLSSADYMWLSFDFEQFAEWRQKVRQDPSLQTQSLLNFS